MSRIEEALQKASRSREKGTGVAVVERVERVERVIPSFTPPPMEPVAVDNPFIVTVRDPHSPASEEFRKLKSLIVNLGRQDALQNCIMVTSALMGEGKSITALNLAITLAEEHDHTVLLVDADLRKPSLHSYLGLSPQTGLSECLNEGKDVGEAIVRTGLGKLSLLPGGKPVRNPTELFSSQRTRDIFSEIKHRYQDRYIIIDTPPALPFAETRILGSMVDSLVFVVREGTSNVQQVKETLQSLKEVPCLGVVYNDAHKSAVTGHYGNNYGYGYGGNGSPPAGKPDAGAKSRFSFLKGKGRG